MPENEETPGPSVRTLAFMAIPAVAIGIVSALVLWLLDTVSGLLEDWVWQTLPATFGADQSTPWWIFIVLTVTGAAVGLVVQFVPGHAGEDSATTELATNPPKLYVVPGLLLAVLLSLAGGVSLGPENPIIAVNSAIAVAALARLGGKIPQPVVVLLASAATIGALFGTPVAAALVLTGMVAAVKAPGSLWDKMFLPLTAAGTAALTMHLLGGSSIAFELPSMESIEPIDVLTGAVVAVGAALVGILAAWLLPFVHRAFHALKYPIVFTTLGGAVLGLLGIIGGPITLFKGLEQTGELLDDPGGYTAGELALFAAVKVVALLIAASAGFRGGRIFPTVFIGAALGLLAAALIPDMPISLAVASATLGMTLAATRDGWIAIFLAVALVGDVVVLPLLCVLILPVWLLVTRAPKLVVSTPDPVLPKPSTAR
ncbi:ion channel protein [Agromyces sp. MMS24-K17]|uniref:ion channel protein n=1 Tax=Agromyces sp. MMS24-K17 TaxID=3372850 RepID=UPI0037550E7C